jgi:hypothetical protein
MKPALKKAEQIKGKDLHSCLNLPYLNLLLCGVVNFLVF